MADVKISNLPASTVPLAGTEVLPIVQSGTTKKVSVANLTAGRAVDALSVTVTTLSATNNASINGLTVGKGTSSLASNTAVGVSALFGTNSGTGWNTAFGFQAGRDNTTGAANTFIGRNAGLANNGSSNVAVGNQALQSNTTGGSNIAIGSAFSNAGPLGANTTGSNNVAIGEAAVSANTTGEKNVGIGRSALALTTASNNTAIGYQAGNEITTGSGNVIIGHDASASSATAVNQIVLGNGVTGQADTNVTIGNASGKIYNAYTVDATWTQTSDKRLKKNIQNDSLGLSFINRLQPVTYQWKASNELDPSNPYYAEENLRTTGITMHGLIAQDVKTALDAEDISTFAGWDEGSDGIQAISREMFVMPLINAVKELSAKVAQLQIELQQIKKT